ncbi:hypothetical protein CHH28_06390 [Bacterioplanes sanyensis]|uniref:Lysozyme inhibitor LprI-like N-terminal domain-containing protein n=1 Tax=Bacterioplanes sanyensis TaxID=1249553 RepID=A0A222FHU3_9GAMM|nr:lysozyme inhibitor LprI family protein [Bacterioplanes sanyensis]ASP38330.1 hypothetical protein CHH28_06390 [Bacterioplanes sanyensis]
MDVRWIVIPLLGLLAAAVQAASFDCERASTKVEHAICDNKPLGELDEQLSQVFSTIKSDANSNAFSSLLNSQRSWLKQRNKICGGYTDENLSNCLIAKYQGRIKRLKKLLNTQYPSLNEVYGVCHSVSDSQEIVRDGSYSQPEDAVFDINNDGKNEKSAACSPYGTSDLPCREFFDSNGDRVRFSVSDPRLIRDPYNMMPIVEYFRAQGRVYSKHSDLQVGTYIGYVSPDNTRHLLCAWDYQNHYQFSPVAENSAENKVCDAVNRGNVNYLHLSDPAVMDRSETLRVRGSPSRITGQGYLDINNDGKDELVAAVEYASGCSYRYYDELSQDGKTFKYSRVSTPLLQMQGVRFRSHNLDHHPGAPNCGGTKNRLFRYQGVVYYHMINGSDQTVSTLQGEDIIPVCLAKRTISSELIDIWPGI